MRILGEGDNIDSIKNYSEKVLGLLLYLKQVQVIPLILSVVGIKKLMKEVKMPLTSLLVVCNIK